MAQESLTRSLASEDPLGDLSVHYRHTQEYLAAIVASTSDAICTTDMRGRIVFFNPGAEKMLGLPAAEVVGRPAHLLYGGGRGEAERIMRLLARRGGVSNHETIFLGRGRKIHASLSAALLKDRGGQPIGTFGISKDITERVELERRLRELSIQDDLTGLFNKRHCRERLGAEIVRARRQRERLSLIMIDLDRFKEINDRWGHVEGDAILRRVGLAVTRSIRGRVDAGFRYGGDEFVVLLPGMGLATTQAVARRIQENVGAAEGRPPVVLSWGVASLDPRDTPQTLLQRADRRMYRVKQAKKVFPAAVSLLS